MSEEQLTLDVYTDYVCPWCYLASDSVEKLAKKGKVEIRWIPFPLHPGTPDEGMNLKDWLGPGIDNAHQRLYGIMDSINLEYNQDRVMTYNSRLAQELGMWGDTQEGGGAALHKALFRAYFVHDRNIADKAVLLDCVRQAGMNTEEAKDVIEKRTFSKAVDQAWNEARQRQINGVPSFVAGAYMASGYQPLEELEKFLEYAEIQQARM